MKATLTLILSTLVLTACQGGVTESPSSLASSSPALSSIGPFQKNDKIVCGDDVSGYVSTIKIVDVAPASAYVKMVRGQDTRFFPQARVAVKYELGHLVLTLSTPDGLDETFEISRVVKQTGKGDGMFLDGGDSRGVDCELKQGRILGSNGGWEDEYRLNETETAQFLGTPEAFSGILPAGIVELGMSEIMKVSHADLVKALQAAAKTPEEEQLFLGSISMTMGLDGDVWFVWLSGIADDRAASQYQARFEVQDSTGELLDWSYVEFVDHP